MKDAASHLDPICCTMLYLIVVQELLNPLTDGNEDAEDALMASGPGAKEDVLPPLFRFAASLCPFVGLGDHLQDKPASRTSGGDPALGCLGSKPHGHPPKKGASERARE